MTTDVCRRDGDREGGREGDCVRDRKEAEWKKVDKKEKGKETAMEAQSNSPGYGTTSTMCQKK